MRILLATAQIPFVSGGAEILAQGLQAALRGAGHEAETVAIPFKWYPPEAILDNMLACRMLDLQEVNGQPVDLLIGLKFPAYLIRHPNKVLWLLHQHRPAYDLWGHPEYCDLLNKPNGKAVRDAIREADRTLLPEARRIFTISQKVSQRLQRYNSLHSTALYHPPMNAQDFYCAPSEDYLFYPSRLSPPKRQDLVVRALALTRHPVIVVIAGGADNPHYEYKLHTLSQELGVANRVAWLGRISEDEKRHRYAYSAGVIFPPLDEDYGYISLEAMLSEKPIITCTDSGGTLEFVVDGETGLVAEPTPESLAKAMDALWENRPRAFEMGKAGRARYAQLDISWSRVVEELTSERGAPC